MEPGPPSRLPPPAVATRRATNQTAVGVTLVLLSPIIFFFSFAVAAVVFGEPRVESGGDLAWVSYAAVIAAVGVGSVLVATDLFGLRIRLGQAPIVIGLVVLLLGGFGALYLGLKSIVDGGESSDPSIGAAILFAVGFGLIIVAGVALVRRRSNVASG